MSGFISNSEKETKDFAFDLAKKLKGSDILAIYGNLGAGKTTFIQGLAAGLGYLGRVFSPTFVIIRPYKITGTNRTTTTKQKNPKIKTLYHVDLYRIEEETDLKTLGIEEFLNDKGAICAIEWPEKIEKYLSENTIKIRFETLGENDRKITISGLT